MIFFSFAKKIVKNIPPLLLLNTTFFNIGFNRFANTFNIDYKELVVEMIRGNNINFIFLKDLVKISKNF